MKKYLVKSKNNHVIATFFAFLMCVFSGVYVSLIALAVVAAKFNWAANW